MKKRCVAFELYLLIKRRGCTDWGKNFLKMCCGCQLSYLVPNTDFYNTILLSLHVYPSENIAKSTVVRNFEKYENQILTYTSKQILKTVLFHAYTFLQKLFTPFSPASFTRILDNPCEPSASWWNSEFCT